MSRQEIKGETFTIAFGVDRVTGAFAQLWVNPCEDQDGALVIIDSHGVHDESQPDLISKELFDYLEKQSLRFSLWYANKNEGFPNLDEQLVIELARHAGGFPDITADVYRIFGDNC